MSVCSSHFRTRCCPRSTSKGRTCGSLASSAQEAPHSSAKRHVHAADVLLHAWHLKLRPLLRGSRIAASWCCDSWQACLVSTTTGRGQGRRIQSGTLSSALLSTGPWPRFLCIGTRTVGAQAAGTCIPGDVHAIVAMIVFRACHDAQARQQPAHVHCNCTHSRREVLPR